VTPRPPSPRRALALGLTTGAFYFWGTLYWLVQTMTTFGGLSTATSAFAALMLVAYLALFPGLFAVFQAAFARRWGRAALLIALA
jgi:apolipoprotein N-acyltransferase